MSKQRGYWNETRILKIIVFTVIIGLVVLGLLITAFIWERAHGNFPGQGKELYATVEYNDQTYIRNSHIKTALVIGLDTFEWNAESKIDNADNDMVADFLMLLVLDTKAKTVKALHINRDTMADIGVLGITGQKVGTVHRQIALAHTEGNGKHESCRNVVNAVSDLLGGVRIDYYMSLKMDAVQIINDAVGGVTLEVIGDFSGTEHSFQKGETVTLLGEDALLYVRARKGVDDQTNLARMERQKQYLGALYEKLIYSVEGNDAFAEETMRSIADYMISNCQIDVLEKLVDRAASYEFDGIRALSGEAVKGERFMEFTPDPDALQQTILELFYTVK